MRLIVDLCRYIVYASCALVVTVTALVTISTIDGTGLVLEDFSAGNIIAIVAVFLLFALAIGVLAVLVSLHDLHLKLVSEAKRISGALEKLQSAAGRAEDASLPTEAS